MAYFSSAQRSYLYANDTWKVPGRLHIAAAAPRIARTVWVPHTQCAAFTPCGGPPFVVFLLSALTPGASLCGMSAISETALAPPKPLLDGDHERMAHIVLEGVSTEDGDFVSAGPTVVEGMVMGTPVRALCGKVWVPGRDPKKYPLCHTCKDIAEQMGWAVPAS